MLKKWIRFSQSVVAVLAISSFYVFFATADTGEVFLPGASINNITVSGLNVTQAADKVRNYYLNDYQLEIITAGQKKEKIAGSDIAYQMELPDMTNFIRQNRDAGENKFSVDLKFTFNEDALKEKLAQLESVSGNGVVKTVNAHISGYEEGKPFTIVPETQGNSIDNGRLLNSARHELMTGSKALYVEPLGCYEVISVTAEDQSLKDLCDRMNRYLDMSVTYVFGEKTEVLSGSTIASWLIQGQDQSIVVNRDQVAQHVAQLAGKYDTVNRARPFKTASGRDVQVSGAYGWQINQAAEIQALMAMIQTGETQSRTPEYSKGAASRTLSDWGNTYVEIDLTGQHVYLFQDGVLKWEAPCVTGNIAKGHTTPEGLYTLNYKQTDRVLRGKKMADGTYEYESPVKYWMPFNGGIGLHDANWRNKFGGQIYKNSGSHGCINLPPNTVKQLYDLVYPGIPVICYNY